MIALYNPFRDALKTYKKYDVSQLQGSFRSIMVLKNRFGDCDVEIGTAFYGWINYFHELPLPDEIYDYEKYRTPRWISDNIEEKEDDSKIIQKSKFVL